MSHDSHPDRMVTLSHREWALLRFLVDEARHNPTCDRSTVDPEALKNIADKLFTAPRSTRVAAMAQ